MHSISRSLFPHTLPSFLSASSRLCKPAKCNTTDLQCKKCTYCFRFITSTLTEWRTNPACSEQCCFRRVLHTPLRAAAWRDLPTPSLCREKKSSQNAFPSRDLIFSWLIALPHHSQPQTISLPAPQTLFKQPALDTYVSNDIFHLFPPFSHPC